MADDATLTALVVERGQAVAQCQVPKPHGVGHSRPMALLLQCLSV